MSQSKQAKGLPADKSENLKKAIVMSKESQTLVSSLQEEALIEAQQGQEYETFRAKHWAKVMRNWQHDAPELAKYPQMVRHAKAKLLGLDMSKKPTQWEPYQKKLYTVYCANHISPLVMFIDLALGKGKDQPGIGCDKVINLLESAGTLPQKISQGRLLLAKPVRQRGTKTQNETTVDKAEKEVKALSASGTPLQLDKKRPIEAAIMVITASLTSAECVIVAQSVCKRLLASKDANEKILGEKIKNDLDAYFKAEDGEASEQTQLSDVVGKVQATA